MRLLLILLLWTSVTYGQNEFENKFWPSEVDILNPTQSKLNNSISLHTTTQQLLKQLGSPSKVEKVNFECALTPEQEKAKVHNFYYYGKTMFFIYDQKAQLMNLDFISGKFIYKTPKITLTSKTTFEEIEKIYPQATKNALKENKGEMIRLRPCKKCDGQVLLYMKNGKLAQLELWEPC
jgi:hypothetical protein